MCADHVKVNVISSSALVVVCDTLPGTVPATPPPPVIAGTRLHHGYQLAGSLDMALVALYLEVGSALYPEAGAAFSSVRSTAVCLSQAYASLMRGDLVF